MRLFGMRRFHVNYDHVNSNECRERIRISNTVYFSVVTSLCGQLVFGDYEINDTEVGVYHSAAEGRQLIENPKYSSVTFNNFKPITAATSTLRSKSHPVVRTGKIKMRMVESNSVMDSDDQHLYEDRPLHQHYGIPYMYTGPNNGQGSGFYVQRPQQQGYEEYMHDIEAKEAALKGFGVGLAIGLGALGSLTGLLKLIWIPLLALGALLPLLLLFTTPIPVISMGKMLLGSVNVKQARLQDAIEEVMKKLPENLSKTSSVKES
ncbi:uncharacterized protein LOC110841732 isoform X2 [Folsomia candida]|uniref:uncharacterized protein LOC110841732 isoform X2 n=1 Tax=Folsomia candida TaxID=158441 RepID=UPI0016053D62|nr:uncharacterized protein LOC110841732 isoform X2 [Folsomia candida]